jgi:hypothetical protein
MSLDQLADEIADLTLIVGPMKFVFRVSKHAFRLASPV